MNLIPNADTEMVLAQLCHTLQLGSQLADAPMRTVDGYFAQLRKLGIFHRSIVLGPVIVSRAYGVDGPGDSGELVQAALTTNFGAAAVFWNSEDYSYAREAGTSESDAFAAARPLRDCVPAIRAVLWPHIPPLVVVLLGQVDIS